MALSANANYRYTAGRTTAMESHAVLNGSQVYKHAFVVVQAGGYLAPLTDTAGAKFKGLALEKVLGDTSADPDVRCRVDESGVTLKDVAVTNASAVTDNNSLVYASADDTLTLSATSNLGAVGFVKEWKVGTTCDVTLFSAAEYEAKINVA